MDSSSWDGTSSVLWGCIGVSSAKLDDVEATEGIEGIEEVAETEGMAGIEGVAGIEGMGGT